MTDAELQAAFATCTLPAAALRHVDHVRLAWLYLRAAPAATAIATGGARFVGDLRRFAAAHGVPDRYHETITWAWLLLVNERLGRVGPKGVSASWDEFIAANADLLASDALLRWYHAETLASPLARAVFLLPDRLAPRLAAPAAAQGTSL